MKSICVYCGSNSGSRPVYAERAASLGRMLASQGLAVVYGGGNVGLMGIVANAVLEAGGDTAAAMAAAGYRSRSHFTRAFRQAHGRTPGASRAT